MAIRNGETIATVTTLGVRIGAVEGDISEIKQSLLGLNNKIERTATDLAVEVRSSIAGLSTQLAERQKTPWVVIFTGITVMISVMGFVGSQALAPLQTGVQELKANMVPRTEYETRHKVFDGKFAAVETDLKDIGAHYLPRSEHDNLITYLTQRFTTLDTAISHIEQRRYDERNKIIDDLRARLRVLERTPN